MTNGESERTLPGERWSRQGSKLKTSNGHLERALNQLHALELSCDRQPSDSQLLHPTAPVFRPVRMPRQQPVQGFKKWRENENEQLTRFRNKLTLSTVD